MVSDILSVGDKVDVLRWVNTAEEKGEPTSLASRVLDLEGERNIRISMPLDKTRIVPLEPGEIYPLYFYTAKGIYTAKCSVAGRYQENNVGVLVMELVSEPERLQRRQFYRVACVMDVRAKSLSDRELKEVEELEQDERTGPLLLERFLDRASGTDGSWEEGIVTDISGGGVCFTSRRSKNKGDVILLRMELVNGAEKREHRLLAQVISSEEIVTKPGYYENRSEFVRIQEPDREEIIHFVFEEDRKRRRRERGLE